ncbi:MAG: hypothetical protein HRU75_11655 [Planctomycetia bacterium]|nr:MAG: hypothetical protein HRU75_11655 [Planctomycetia bacterium]
MRRTTTRNWLIRTAAMFAGTSLFLNGCDPGIRSTVENGLITTTQAGLSSVFQAMLQLWQEANDA